MRTVQHTCHNCPAVEGGTTRAMFRTSETIKRLQIGKALFFFTPRKRASRTFELWQFTSLHFPCALPRPVNRAPRVPDAPESTPRPAVDRSPSQRAAEQTPHRLRAVIRVTRVSRLTHMVAMATPAMRGKGDGAAGKHTGSV